VVAGIYSLDGFISIHTPARGVTLTQDNSPASGDISIHTPARGVTIFVTDMHLNKRYFNPHTREGCDQIQVEREVPEERFQSTHPRGV